MIKSMTGFGRFEADADGKKVTVEIKSVNHRYLELSVRLPKKLSFFEAGIRNLLKQYISRGKVDVYVTYENAVDNSVLVHYHEALAAEYMAALTRMSESFGMENDMKISSLARFPEVFTLEEASENEEELFELLEQAVHGAAKRFVETRAKEGEHLRQDIYCKLDAMTNWVCQIEERAPQILEEYRKKLYDKVAELLGETPMDEGRLATEITLFADKICVDEETVRLQAHIRSMKDTLADGAGVGRKLDFIAQEMNREANTILSKANDLTVTEIAINLKTEIEKIREQIQNLE